MTYGKDYTLADKMQKQFRNRGSEVSGMQASSTAELMRRAEMGRDPRVNCAEQAFRESYRTRNNPGTQKTRTDAGYQRRAGQQTERTAHQPRRVQNEQPKRDSFREVKTEVTEPAVEIPVRQKGFSPMFIALLIVATLMVLVLVFSISEAYQTTSEIARLETELEELEKEADELRLRLEEKNDIRTIEKIATEELGMVKEDSLQRRYVSLSDGEYIELLNTEEESEEQTGGVLLSSIFTALGDFFDRFK